MVLHPGAVWNAVKESALKADSREKSLATPGTQTCTNIPPRLFSWMLYQMSYSSSFYQRSHCNTQNKFLNTEIACIHDKSCTDHLVLGLCHFRLWRCRILNPSSHRCALGHWSPLFRTRSWSSRTTGSRTESNKTGRGKKKLKRR